MTITDDLRFAAFVLEALGKDGKHIEGTTQQPHPKFCAVMNSTVSILESRFVGAPRCHWEPVLRTRRRVWGAGVEVDTLTPSFASRSAARRATGRGAERGAEWWNSCFFDGGCLKSKNPLRISTDTVKLVLNWCCTVGGQSSLICFLEGYATVADPFVRAED